MYIHYWKIKFNIGFWCSKLDYLCCWALSTDRRKVYVNLRTHVPERLLQLNSETRTVQATNDYDKLKVYLYFSAPVLNSSTEIMNSLNISQGSLLPISEESLGNHRFGFLVSWFMYMISCNVFILFFIPSVYLLLTPLFFFFFSFGLFWFQISNISPTAIISVDFNSESIISRQGTQFSPTAPVTFLYGTCHPPR